jgi:hypothetical protein
MAKKQNIRYKKKVKVGIFFHCPECIRNAKRDLELAGYHPTKFGKKLLIPENEIEVVLDFLGERSTITRIVDPR